jgi:hypothetical protein
MESGDGAANEDYENRALGRAGSNGALGSNKQTPFTKT